MELKYLVKPVLTGVGFLTVLGLSLPPIMKGKTPIKLENKVVTTEVLNESTQLKYDVEEGHYIILKIILEDLTSEQYKCLVREKKGKDCFIDKINPPSSQDKLDVLNQKIELPKLKLNKFSVNQDQIEWGFVIIGVSTGMILIKRFTGL